MRGSITSLYHYPVKGLSPQPLPSVDLAAGQGFPFDRVFALARHDSGCDPRHFRPLPKSRFHMLARDAELARLASRYDPEDGVLEIALDGKTVLAANLDEETGASAAASFVATYLGLPAGAAPYLARAGENRFTDVSVRSAEMMNAVSLINLASVRAFEERIGRPVDPLRFRANIYFDGWPAWSEFDLIGSGIAIGEATLRPCLRTRRCPATQVDPATAERDLDVPALLAKHYGHSDLGIYAEVTGAGTVAPGAEIVAE